MDLKNLTLEEIAREIREGRLSSRDATEYYLERISSFDGAVNSYITVTEERAREEAAACDEEQARGKLKGPLHGVPVGLKDIFCTKGVRTTCGSRMLENFIPPYDSEVYRRLREAGAVLLGKQNMDEFAMGSSTETSYFGPTRNPHDLSRIPGGSSGGSAAAVAAGLSPTSVGTDTGGSIRQPAALCGVVGMKPTYGRVSRFGMVAFASSLDQAGPITTSVRDAAFLLGVISGHDPKDSTSVNVDVPDYLSFCGREVSGMTVGVPEEYFIEGMEEEVRKRVEEAVERLSSLGCRIERIRLPHTDYALACYYIVAPAEASSNLARYDGVKYGYRTESYEGLIDMYMKTRAEGFGSEVKRRIMLGTYALSAGYYEAFYGKALRVRSLIKRDFLKAFETVDVIVAPTSPTTAFGLGERLHDPLTMYLSDIFTIPVNLAGLPAISIPCGEDGKGLPVGVQIIGKHFREEEIFQVAFALESELGRARVVDPESTAGEGE
ncbi:MAG: Asp-tRNA(Asn)/Glu-tRNA(Gln) amidotransferase subunit GatA [Deltaproteobacteria bacterium]|nr:MAG: Asp-tRNA(Asn)/Glu-tRNA(Gln) amidotransferase subunit GatA [Deltaproteobacteria bacterium]